MVKLQQQPSSTCLAADQTMRMLPGSPCTPLPLLWTLSQRWGRQILSTLSSCR